MSDFLRINGLLFYCLLRKSVKFRILLRVGSALLSISDLLTVAFPPPVWGGLGEGGAGVRLLFGVVWGKGGRVLAEMEPPVGVTSRPNQKSSIHVPLVLEVRKSFALTPDHWGGGGEQLTMCIMKIILHPSL